MIELTDQLGNKIRLEKQSRRIISLVPSITELLSYLDLHDETIGITRFCVHPAEWFNSKTSIGGTKNLRLDKIFSLQPDLIIANKEENVKDQVDALAENCTVYTSDVNDLDTALQMILDVGKMTGKDAPAMQLTTDIIDAFQSLSKPHINPRVCYLIWRKPYMTVGGDTFIQHMLERAGFQNIYADTSRYPEVDLQNMLKRGCEQVLLSSEPFPFKQSHALELQNELADLAIRQQNKVPAIQLVDGEIFSWYGSRLLKAPAYFESLRKKMAIS